jgi:uncharacterized iron-regulated protein|tara:strand:- start:1065 stop:1379 length:315 start_codon:yes stop_codon:yes gene_type:complete
MSILFKPKIKESYEYLVPESRKTYTEGKITKTILDKKPKTEYNPLSSIDIERLIQLRGANISYNNIAKLLKRSPAYLGWVVHDKSLRMQIRTIQKKIIEEIMND